MKNGRKSGKTSHLVFESSYRTRDNRLVTLKHFACLFLTSNYIIRNKYCKIKDSYFAQYKRDFKRVNISLLQFGTF